MLIIESGFVFFQIFPCNLKLTNMIYIFEEK